LVSIDDSSNAPVGNHINTASTTSIEPIVEGFHGNPDQVDGEHDITHQIGLSTQSQLSGNLRIPPVILEDNEENTDNSAGGGGSSGIDISGIDISLDLKKSGENWYAAFHDTRSLNKEQLKSPKGWQTIFRTIFFLYPRIVTAIIKDFTGSFSVELERANSTNEEARKRDFVRNFERKRESDNRFLIRTGYEFGYIIVAIYFSYLMYGRFFLNDYELKPIWQMPSKPTDVPNGTNLTLQHALGIFLFPCDFFCMLFTGVKYLLSNERVWGTYLRNIQYIFCFILCYNISYNNICHYIPYQYNHHQR